jgi:hypothetical protein
MIFYDIVKDGAAARRGRDTSSIVLRPSRTEVQARHALYGHRGPEGDRLIAVLHEDPQRQTIHIENKATFNFLLTRQGETRPTIRLEAGKRAVVNSGSQIVFGEPRADTLTRCARLILPSVVAR